MKKFLVTYHVPAEAAAQQMEGSSPEQQAEGMKEWMNWAQRAGDHLVDMGAPLMNGKQIHPGNSVTNSNRDFSGYSILQANDIEEAKALMNGHPHINGWNKDASIEVSETMPIPGM